MSPRAPRNPPLPEPETASAAAAAAADAGPRCGAFFDMDKTLISENSGSLYLRDRYALGEVGRRELARWTWAYLRYRLGLLGLNAFSRELGRPFAGRREAELRREAQAFVTSRVVPKLYPAALARLGEHRAQGHTLALVSGAIGFVVLPLAQHLDVELAVYTRLAVEGGILSGRVVEPACFGAGKLYWLRRLSDAHRIDLARSWFYTDSITDLPLLEAVGHPVAVNPDLRLYCTARRRRWPIERFRAPPPPRPTPVS